MTNTVTIWKGITPFNTRTMQGVRDRYAEERSWAENRSVVSVTYPTRDYGTAETIIGRPFKEIGLRIDFADEADALLFKLTWGGSR